MYNIAATLWQRLGNVREQRCHNVRNWRRYNSHFRPSDNVVTTSTTTSWQLFQNVAVPAGLEMVFLPFLEVWKPHGIEFCDFSVVMFPLFCSVSPHFKFHFYLCVFWWIFQLHLLGLQILETYSSEKMHWITAMIKIYTERSKLSLESYYWALLMRTYYIKDVTSRLPINLM